MSIKIKYFGAIAEQVGVQEELLDQSFIGKDAEAVKNFCFEKYGLQDQEAIQVAVNQTLNTVEQLKDGDEIALLPPFAGG